MKYAVGLNSGTDALWLAFMALGREAGRRDHHHRQHLLRHRRGDLDRRRARPCSWTATRGRATSIPPRSRPPSPAHRGHRAGAPLRPVRGHEGDLRRSPRSTSCGWSRTTPRRLTATARASSRASCRTRCARASSSRRTSAPSATAARSSPTAPTSTTPSAGCATTARRKRSVHSFGFNSRLDDLHAAVLSVKLQAHHEVDATAAARSPRATPRGSQGTQLRAAVPSRPATATSSTSTSSSTPKRDELEKFLVDDGRRRQAALPDRHPPAGGLPLGQARRRQVRTCRTAEQQRRPVRVAADVPRADRRRGRRTPSSSARAWDKSERVTRGQ